MPLFDLATEQEKSDMDKRLATEDRSQLSSDAGSKMFDCIARHWVVRRRDEHDGKFGESWAETVTHAWYFDSQQLAARFAGFRRSSPSRVLYCETWRRA